MVSNHFDIGLYLFGTYNLKRCAITCPVITLMMVMVMKACCTFLVGFLNGFWVFDVPR